MDPSVADYTPGGFASFPSGDFTNGRITLQGYNGRPLIEAPGLWFYATSNWTFKNIAFKFTGNSFGALDLSSGFLVYDNCLIDQNGYDVSVTQEGNTSMLSCWCRNTGSSFSGSNAAMKANNYSNKFIGNFVDGWNGGAYDGSNSLGGSVSRNVIVNCPYTGGAIRISGNSTFSIEAGIIGNTIANNIGDGIYINDNYIASTTPIRDNLIYGSGGYNINCNTSPSGDVFMRGLCDENFVGGATSGNYNGFSGGANDVHLTANPFTNAGAKDYTLNNTAGGGAAVKGVGYPNTYGDGLTVGSIDGGSVQSAGGGGTTILNFYPIE
jgi:hypothetical protein